MKRSSAKAIRFTVISPLAGAAGTKGGRRWSVRSAPEADIGQPVNLGIFRRPKWASVAIRFGGNAMKLIGSLGLVLALFTGRPATAGEWVKVGDNRSAFIALDISSIERRAGIATAWTMIGAYQTDTNFEPAIDYWLVRFNFVCAEWKSQPLVTLAFNENGIVSEAQAGELSFVSPDGLRADAFRSACRNDLPTAQPRYDSALDIMNGERAINEAVMAANAAATEAARAPAD